jgi:RimJ/RimL family protein N-acetyltransferase
LGFPL